MLRIAWSDLYAHPLPEGHRFPMLKYALIPEQLVYEGTIRESQLFEPGHLDEKWITFTHLPAYWHKLRTLQLNPAEERKTGFPQSERLIARETCIAQGTIECAHYALKEGIAMNIAGGTHHAFIDRGEGFCLLNDQAIAANYLLANQLAHKILIIDLDVHQGNGTAALFQQNKQVFTFSMHGADNYPLHKEISDYDIALPSGTTDSFYLRTLQQTLPAILDSFEPDFIFYLSGVDVLATDKLGRLALTREGCAARDRYVLALCRQHRLPVVVCMGGGYSAKIQDIVEAHCNTFRIVEQLFF
jgi:acetoin utilization deacetylase AcuC-like enzyme